jgi:hypothetical protein
MNLEYLEKWCDFDSSLFKHFSVLSLKQDIPLVALTNTMEESGLKIDREELYNEYAVCC